MVDLSFFLPIFLFLLYLILINVKITNKIDIPIEIFTVGAAFSGLIIGFIIIYAMQRYDFYINNKNTFIRILQLLHIQYPAELIFSQLEETYKNKTYSEVTLN